MLLESFYMEIKIGHRVVGDNQPIFFIAEAGVNHNGSLDYAKQLIDIAVDAKADAVKFQTFKADKLNTVTAPKSKYHIETTGSDKKQSWYELLQSQEISLEMHKHLIDYCNKKEIIFLSTPYDKDSADLLDDLGVSAFKIASTDTNNYQFLEYVAKKKKPMKSVCVCEVDGSCQCDTEIKKLTFLSDVKAVNDKGTFTGYGSIFGNEDQGSDIMQKGAFTKSLENRPAPKVKMLYQHKTDEPIGVFEDMYEDEKGLFVKGRLAMGTQKGREAYELLKMGALDGMSIGFRADPDKQGYNENMRGTRTLKEVDLMEISLVTFPMNERALIENVKASQKNIREWEKILRDAGGLSRTEAKIGAKALSESLSQRDAVDDNKQLATLINKVADILKQ